MKTIKERLLIHFSGQVSYKTAFALSILLHGLIFLFLALLINPIQFSNIDKLPLVIKLASTSGDENRGATYQITKGIIQQSFQHNNLIPPDSYSSTAFPKSIKTENPISQVAEHHTTSHVAQPYFAVGFVPPSVKFPRIDIAQPKLLAAKMPVSEQQQKILTRQITRLIEKLTESELTDTTFVVENNNQKYEIQIRHLPASSATELDEVLFDITTEENGKLLSTQVRTRRLAFSSFAQLVDRWDPQVAIHDDIFEGRFHSNYAFAISRSKGITPKFQGKVTTAAYNIRTNGNFPIIDQSSIFIGGIETGVKQIRLPKTFSQFSDHSTLNRDQLHVFNDETWITFHKDGFYSWQSKASPKIEHRTQIPASSFYIIGIKGARIHVKGTVNGKVLVYSADHIIIDDDLFYAQPPDKFPHSDDYLGLVSEKNVEIAHPSITGSGDLHIYAAIFARGYFRIPNLYGSGEATLFIYGSLSAGSLTATEPRYATHIRFDKRLDAQRPPNFPVTDRYEIADWDKTWEINENNLSKVKNL